MIALNFQGVIMGKGWKAAGKSESAQKKGALFTKLAREIAVASKTGGPDPAMNARLRMAIDAAPVTFHPAGIVAKHTAAHVVEHEAPPGPILYALLVAGKLDPAAGLDMVGRDQP